MHTGKRAYLYGFVVLFVLGMASLAEAGPMSIKVTNAEAGGMSGNKQAIVFWMTIKNTTSHEYIHKLNYAIVEVTGSWGNGRQEKYQRSMWTGYLIRRLAQAGARISKPASCETSIPARGCISIIASVCVC